VNRAGVDGDRIFLRQPNARDLDEFLDRARASRKLHGRWVTAPSDPEAFGAYLQRAESADVETLLVCRRDDGAIVGVFNISQIFYGSFCSAYLGYYAFEPFAGQGYMREGIRLVLRHAFGPLGLHRLEANIQPGNDASLALVRAAGFRREGLSPRYLKIAGRWRDHERWAILAEGPHRPVWARRT
jgi:[ribosomal protein S5]-alanine N-acetyltransferase